MDPNAQDNGGAAGPDAVGPATTAVGVLHAGSESTFAAGGAAAIGGDGGGASADTAVVAEPTRGAPSTVAQVPGGPTGDWDGAAGMQLIDLSRAASPVAQLVGSGRDSVPLGLAAERSVQGSPSVPLVLSPSQLAAAGASSSSPPSGREDSSLGSSSSPTLSPQPVAAAVPPTRAGSASEFHDRGSSPPSGREDSSLGSSPSLRTLSPRGAGGAEDTPVASSPAESGSAHSGASDNEGPQAGPAAVEASGASAASPQGAKPHPKPPHIHSLRVQTTSDADAPRPTPRVATKKASELPGWGGSQRLRRRRYSTGSAPVHLAPEARKNEPFESYLSRFMSRCVFACVRSAGMCVSAVVRGVLLSCVCACWLRGAAAAKRLLLPHPYTRIHVRMPQARAVPVVQRHGAATHGPAVAPAVSVTRASGGGCHDGLDHPGPCAAGIAQVAVVDTVV